METSIIIILKRCPPSLSSPLPLPPTTLVHRKAHLYCIPRGRKAVTQNQRPRARSLSRDLPCPNTVPVNNYIQAPQNSLLHNYNLRSSGWSISISCCERVSLRLCGAHTTSTACSWSLDTEASARSARSTSLVPSMTLGSLVTKSPAAAMRSATTMYSLGALVTSVSPARARGASARRPSALLSVSSPSLRRSSSASCVNCDSASERRAWRTSTAAYIQ
ncbi:unnamed protein product [Chondrus crispus]|uniref:Uncharacterized protein n=1 Tax=Chondrus crispus TaxID=2769 RepID=R7QH72_CHOCR|nr:unnamed protein product [Chondrus crispus]CDF36816.1 unnamed protein product [Chondrus crispus]|eukprot:XP_005716635.1 unnamed protein product [Chondrus crispus]